MKRFVRILFLLITLGVAVSCVKEAGEPVSSIPEGTPVMMHIAFGAEDYQEVQIGTKAEASRADETRVHDVYVIIFDNQGEVVYRRYFTYEHLNPDWNSLLEKRNEGWFVENLKLEDSGTDKKTQGVVKISTVSKSDCKLVLLANISNTVTSINGKEAVEWLTDEMHNKDDFDNAKVTLEQNIVNRSNLFLMMGEKEGVNTGDMAWDKTNGNNIGNYGQDYKIQLTPLDAKVKFRIRYDETNISSITPRYWTVYNLPDRCTLPLKSAGEVDANAMGVKFFSTDKETYFEGTERDGDSVWQVFSFYMLENRPFFKKSAGGYHDRDKQLKNSDGTNQGKWEYAPDNGTYVKFDVILNLTTSGIQDILDDPRTNHALTSDALFTVHLGNFGSSEGGGSYNDYAVERGHFYTYNITIVNSKKIYIEVIGDRLGIREDEPGQEGSLLLTTDDIINSDAHYEYHSLVFPANPDLADSEAQKKMSWYVKTPFTPKDGRPELVGNRYVIPKDSHGNPTVDCRWVLFGLNKMKNGIYSANRIPYPGYGAYKPDWNPDEWVRNDPDKELPQLIDINQLVNLLFVQNEKRKKGDDNLFDSSGNLRFTAFVDEYYYEVNPLTGELDPDLWRQFVNASPRELHILSEAEYSADRMSDVIKSSHSIIQNSIQTFYNIYNPGLSSIWGVEHIDEMRNRGSRDSSTGVNKSWSWWHGNWDQNTIAGVINDEENGRVNTANIWGVPQAPAWGSFLDYEVDEDTPELKPTYQYMAYSCLTRNRDNNGNGTMDPEELRWYLASINQLVGMYVGNESLSQSARLYQPIDADSSDPLKWRSHVISSTCINNNISNPSVLSAEEAATKSNYEDWAWAFKSGDPKEYRDRIMSVRCVRNVGTYRQQGQDTDISYAPYDWMVDQYYETEKGTDNAGKAFPDEDGGYTVRFSRLDPRSVREYTVDDLPYHDEFSLHNRVYLELHMQNPEDYATGYYDNFSPKQGSRQINDAISTSGRNDYCPPGYRLPNLTELVVMTSLTPLTFWDKKDESTKQKNFPCRTYFSRGAIGTNQTETEKGKIGWEYRKQTQFVGLANDGDKNINAIRCVRDDNMTGDITGKIIVPDYDRLERDKEAEIQLNFTSMASAIRDISLALVYSDASGEHAIPVNTQNVEINGVTLKDQVKFRIPTEDASEAYPLPITGWMKFRCRVYNNVPGMYRDFETPVRVLSSSTVSIKLLPCEYDGRQVTDAPYTFPILLTTYLEGSTISSWSLKIIAPNKAVTTVALGSPEKEYVTSIYRFNPGQLLEGTYTFQLEANGSNGETARSEVVSMKMLKVDYQPNVEDPAHPWEQRSDITGRWEREIVSGLDFTCGDFIETDMDIRECYFRKSGDGSDNSKNIGMDVLVSFGLNDIDWVPWVLNVQYPSRDSGVSPVVDYLNINPTWLNNKTTAYESKKYVVLDTNGDGKVTRPLHIRLEKEGLFWNGRKVDVNRWGGNRVNVQSVIDKLTAANTLYVGSTMGEHSRATYRFVRVVYNERNTAIKGGNDDFKDDPGFGGNL